MIVLKQYGADPTIESRYEGCVKDIILKDKNASLYLKQIFKKDYDGKDEDEEE